MSYVETSSRAEALLTAPGAPFAVVRGGDGRLRYAAGPRTLPEFADAARAHGDAPFLVGEDGTVYTYRLFLRAARALARRLAGAYGLRPGDRAVIAGRNHPEWQVAFWAAQFAGLVAVPLNAWWTAGECAYALDDCAPGVLLADDERVRLLGGWASRNGVPCLDFRAAAREAAAHACEGAGCAGGTVPDACGGVPHAGGGAGCEGGSAAAALPVVRPDDDATILYTSGTTGRPKGAVATHSAQVAAAMNPRYQAAAAALDRGGAPATARPPVSLTTFPFFHAAAFTSVYAVMAAGGTLVLMRRWDAAKALDLVDRHRVTHYAGVPATALQLLDAAAGRRLATLTNLNTGGAPAPPALVRRLTDAYGDRIEPRNGYGLTETCGGVLAHYGEAYRRRPDSVGRPTPVTETRVAGPDGRPLPDGETGELLLRGQSLVRGYWRNPEATAAAFTADGWFRTGDLAVVREDGRISVVDRVKDVVIRGGENVYCAEVEAALYGHPAVAEAAVVGVPHPVLGEEVAAVVRLREASGTVTAGELRAHAARGLAAYKVPAHVVLQDLPLPRNAGGKVLKDRLRDVLAAAGGC
ncbi:acyl--CoA ligase [Streptomyces fradiae]|uniref:class I adenylate-forming enzyme family protein n=1 Tax=Streptomyces fradiae TaxID=1906 RepID=UPI002018585E|nr:class I adenylate-forming enzyme family protein [Streptomyces fradiae]UQS32078.1 acyl--CoA ligase [Streptomyces fradiae]